jgi:hypothetical protein
LQTVTPVPNESGLVSREAATQPPLDAIRLIRVEADQRPWGFMEKGRTEKKRLTRVEQASGARARALTDRKGGVEDGRNA